MQTLGPAATLPAARVSRTSRGCRATNVGGTRNVLAAALAADPRPWVLFASSREIYGQADALPVTEDAPARAMNVYGHTKVAGEALVGEARAACRALSPNSGPRRSRHEDHPGDPRLPAPLQRRLRGLHPDALPRPRRAPVEVDQRLAALLDELRPDLMHVGHLNHVSTSLISEAARRGVPVVYTLHDYWLMCPRGQLMQTHPEDPRDLWAACDGQADRKCAERCYARYFSGAPDERGADVAYWTDWVGRRMRHVRAMADQVDLFIAPARDLLRRYRDEFGLPAGKLVYLDYGFDRARLSGRARVPGEPFTFGYIGTHIPAKGIHHLLEAFARVRGDVRLRIWGRPRGQDTEALHALARALPGADRRRHSRRGSSRAPAP